MVDAGFLGVFFARNLASGRGGKRLVLGHDRPPYSPLLIILFSRVLSPSYQYQCTRQPPSRGALMDGVLRHGPWILRMEVAGLRLSGGRYAAPRGGQGG